MTTQQTEDARLRVTGAPTTATGTNRETVELAPERIYYLQRTQVLLELQTELLSWAKTRFWVVAVVAVVLGFVGMRTIVRDLASDELRNAIRASAEADSAAAAARDSIAKARESVAQYQQLVNELQTHATLIDKHYKELDAQIPAHNENIRTEVRLAKTDIEAQLTDMRAAVSTLLAKVEGARAAQTFTVRDSEQRAKAQTRTTIFADNAKYSVALSYKQTSTPATNRALSLLRSQGYKVEDYPQSDYAIDEKTGEFDGEPPGIITESRSMVFKYNPQSKKKADEVAEILRRTVGGAIRFSQDSRMVENRFVIWLPAH